MDELLDGLRVLISLIFLSYASWADFKTREVSNKVWAIFGPLALLLTIFQYVLSPQDQDLLIYYILPITVTVALSLVFFYAGGFGGADAKALICISLAFPYHSAYLSQLPQEFVFIPFPLSVFIYSAFLASFSVVYVLLRSLFWKHRNKKRLFEGFEKESWGVKFSFY